MTSSGFLARKGSLEKLIRAAVAYARRQGAAIVEAYPTVAKSDHVPPVSAFMGFPKVFEGAGFVEVARPSPTKRIMRIMLR
jgi:hypothetical protein